MDTDDIISRRPWELCSLHQSPMDKKSIQTSSKSAQIPMNRLLRRLSGHPSDRDLLAYYHSPRAAQGPLLPARETFLFLLRGLRWIIPGYTQCKPQTDRNCRDGLARGRERCIAWDGGRWLLHVARHGRRRLLYVALATRSPFWSCRSRSFQLVLYPAHSSVHRTSLCF